MHEHQPGEDAQEPVYWVTAKVTEPDYEVEYKFLAAERAFVDRRVEALSRTGWGKVSMPALGIFGRKDWKAYAHALTKYDKELQEYANSVYEGLLPVKFVVYNASEHHDAHIRAAVKVTDGKVDLDKKPPARPARLDGRSKGSLPKLKWGWPTFVRSNVKMTPHHLSANFSGLGAEDAADLLNKLVHLHVHPDTRVEYEVSSRNVPHEHGEVELLMEPDEAIEPASQPE
jgi:hypothetical protein